MWMLGINWIWVLWKSKSLLLPSTHLSSLYPIFNWWIVLGWFFRNTKCSCLHLLTAGSDLELRWHWESPAPTNTVSRNRRPHQRKLTAKETTGTGQMRSPAPNEMTTGKSGPLPNINNTLWGKKPYWKSNPTKNTQKAAYNPATAPPWCPQRSQRKKDADVGHE